MTTSTLASPLAIATARAISGANAIAIASGSLVPRIQETRDKRHIYLLTFCMHRRLGDGGQK